MLQSGQVINGTYLVDHRLGFGGMADVFLVTHARIPRQFALKLLRVEIGEQRDFLDRFRREAEILASIRSAHIVDVIDWDYTYDGQPFIAMEYLEGETLSALLQRQGALPIETALDIFAQIGEGLCAAHAAGVVHRDLKPSNIFLDRHGGRPNFVKILDFGIAKLTQDARTPLTAHASVMGTPGYMAPEQAVGRLDLVDHRADQFALALILYEMLAGQPAFFTPGEALYRTLERVVHEEPAALPDSPLARALQRALAKQPAARYGSVREFMDAVAAAGERGQDAPQTLVYPASREVDPRPLAAGRRWPLVGAAALLGGAVVVGLVLWGRAAPQSGVGSGGRAGADTRESVAAALPGALAESRPAAAPPETPPAPRPEAAPGPSGGRPEPTAVGGRAADAAAGAAGEPAGVGRRGATAAARTFWFSGVDAAQEKVLRICAEKELRTLPGLPSGVIQLERSGALQVVQGPLVVHRSGLTSCLRQAFAATGSEPPRAATIHVLAARR
jgi:serine/threonine-protein kinase